MINKVELTNFKLYEGINDFYLPGITIVTGTNNSGKSSLLQGIYLLTCTKNYSVPTLILNDELKLGNFIDILNKEKSGKDKINFAVSFDEETLKEKDLEFLTINFIFSNPTELENIDCIEGAPVFWGMDIEFKAKNSEFKCGEIRLQDMKDCIYYIKGDLEKGFCKVNGIMPEQIIYKTASLNEKKSCTKEFDILCYFISKINKEKIKYLSAFRIEGNVDSNYNSIYGVGVNGEYTPEVLEKNFYNETDFKKGADFFKFYELFDLWISKIVGKDYRVRAQHIDKNRYKVVVEDVNYGIEHSLNSVGFGISQIIPILALIFSSNKGDVLLIENPEIHLHPKLQAELVDLFIFALKNGRKIVLETHSEHIINRLRLRIKNENALLNNCNIYFFHASIDCYSHELIEIDNQGRISHWPKDFFDQSYYESLEFIR